MGAKKNQIRYINELFTSPLRIIAIFSVVISAYDVGRAILSFIEYTRMEDIDMFLVILYLITAPLTFAASVLFFYAAKKISEGGEADMPVTVAFGLMILSSVAELISQASTIKSMSVMVLCAIVLTCYIIGFLYYQSIGNRALAIFGAGMGVACAVYYVINGIILVTNEPRQILGYLFTSYLAALLIALTTLMFTLSLAPGDMIDGEVIEEIGSEEDNK